MSLIRVVSIPIFNILPKKIKWKIYSYSFFKKKLRIDFLQTRNKLFAGQSRILVIGANDGISFDDLFNYIDPKNVVGAVVEPSIRYFSQLQNNLKEYSKLNFLNIAISAKNEEKELFQLNQKGLNKMPDWGKGLGSFSKYNLLKFECVEENDIESILVNCISFNTLINKYSLSKVDYLQIDTEGYDAEIIKMIDFNKFSTLLMKYEICNLSDEDKVEVSDKLLKRGFFLVKLRGDMVAYSKDLDPIFN